jgi:hypothetical protein
MESHGAITGLILEAPDKSGHAFSELINARQISKEVAHFWIVRAAQYAPYVDLREVFLDVIGTLQFFKNCCSD